VRPTAESAASRERPGIRMRRWLAPVTGGVAQLGERLLCKQEVIGSIPFTSTISLAAYGVATAAPLRRESERWQPPGSIILCTIVEA
jgi:hypothetical protein